jgi:hypothetical protein
MKVYLAECDKQYKEHEKGQDGIKYGVKELCRRCQRRCISKKEIDKCAYPHCYW